MSDLRTDYKDDVLNTSVNQKRKYTLVNNADETVSYVDATEYSQAGDNFGAADINASNAKINGLNADLTANSKSFHLDYQNSRWGWNETAARGADTFHPFRGKITVPNIIAEFNSVSVTYLMTEINVEDCTLLKIGAISFAGSVLNPTVQIWVYSTALGSYTTAQSNLSFDVSGYPTVRIVVTGVSDQRSLTRKAQVTNITIE